MSMTNSNRELEENTCQCTEDAKFTLFTTEPEENPIVTPEKCPTPVSITIGACEDAGGSRKAGGHVLSAPLALLDEGALELIA